MSFHLRDSPPGTRTEIEFAEEQRSKVEQLLRLRDAEVLAEEDIGHDRRRILVVRR